MVQNAVAAATDPHGSMMVPVGSVRYPPDGLATGNDEMKTNNKAILAAIASLLSLIVCIYFYYVYHAGLRKQQALEQAIEEKAREGRTQGLASGRDHDQAWCLDEARLRAGNKTLEVRNAGPWLYGCLESSAPSSGFCDGIGPPSEQPDFGRQQAVCRARGIKEYCLFYMPTVEAFCHGPMKRRNARERSVESDKGKQDPVKSPDAR
jgi:hypothetical protein